MHVVSVFALVAALAHGMPLASGGELALTGPQAPGLASPVPGTSSGDGPELNDNACGSLTPCLSGMMKPIGNRISTALSGNKYTDGLRDRLKGGGGGLNSSLRDKYSKSKVGTGISKGMKRLREAGRGGGGRRSGGGSRSG